MKALSAAVGMVAAVGEVVGVEGVEMAAEAEVEAGAAAGAAEGAAAAAEAA